MKTARKKTNFVSIDFKNCQIHPSLIRDTFGTLATYLDPNSVSVQKILGQNLLDFRMTPEYVSNKT